MKTKPTTERRITMPDRTAWAHLPNAQHIDRILADGKARPDVWVAAWVAARGAARGAAWDAARGAALDAARDAALDAARDAALDAAWVAARGADRGAARGAAWDAARALVAWDDVAYILDLTPDGCKILIETCTDHHKHAATLLLSACTALNT